MVRPRVFLADDHTLLVDAFRKLLEPEFEIVGTAFNGRDLLMYAPQVHPHLVIVDLGLPLLNGMDAGRALKKLLPATKIVVVTVNEDAAIASSALRDWASGFTFSEEVGRCRAHACAVADIEGEVVRHTHGCKEDLRRLHPRS